MKNQLFKTILLLSCILLLNNHSSNGQGKTIDKFTKAIWGKKPEEAKMYCSNHFWDNPYGQTGKKFVSAAIEEKTSFLKEKANANEKGDRYVFTMIKQVPGKDKESYYFYVVQEGEDWLVDGIDQDENHIEVFMEGKIGGHFEPEHLPEHQELHDFGDLLIKYAHGNEDIPISDFMTGDFQDYIELVRDVEDVEVQKARYSESLDKGAIHFLHMFYEDHEDLTIYFHFKNGKWEPYTYSYHAPHSKDFYMDRIDE